MVEYLDFLDKNDTAYYQYHEWRNLYPDDRQKRPYRLQNLGKDVRPICELCRLVREKRKAGIHQSYKSVMKFLHYDLYPQCKADKHFQDYQKFSSWYGFETFLSTFLGMWKLLLEPIYYCILLSFSNCSISSVNNETWTMVYCFYCKSLVCKKCQV